MLAKAGASTVAVQYGGDRQPNGLAFVIQTDAGSVHYRLTVEVDGVLAALDRACEQRTAAGKRVIPEALAGIDVELRLVSLPFAHDNAASAFEVVGDQATAQAEQQLAHATRLAVEANDPHACSQLPLY